MTSSNTQELKVYYADFECSTDGIHKEYCVCYQSRDGLVNKCYYGKNCATKFLNDIPDKSLIYFHNLSYDINFIINHLVQISKAIIKNSRTLSLKGSYLHNGIFKRFTFKDSYAIISTKLSRFPQMFNLQSGDKEIFPYGYYNSHIVFSTTRGNITEAIEYIKPSDRIQFINNLSMTKSKIDDNTFDMKKYCEYYCERDVSILRQGFEYFRNTLLQEFGLDAYKFISISSIANRYFEREVYWPNGNLYDLSNIPRNFIARCVIGGRCMTADNEKQINLDEPIVDFDAVSLYPSAIKRLYCLEGLPKVLKPHMLSSDYLLKHLFNDEQVEPSKEKYISGFFVHIQIESIGKPLHFPLIVYNKEYNNEASNDESIERATNKCCYMYVDHITLEDLIRFHDAKIKVLRGYYYQDKRDYHIREVIENLFELRLRYKKEKNPLQEIIKLLLNSVYGKTILKPIDREIKFEKISDVDEYFNKNYNTICETTEIYNSPFVKVESMKEIHKHFNFCTLGVNILSMSKRIMNEIFSICEDNNFKVFYQDTDSLHLFEKDIPKLAHIYKELYNRDLIGKSLGQFHSDFPEF